MEFVLTSAVWGAPYVQTFLDHCIPSLLAAGNIPELCSYQRGRYVICTRPQDRHQILNSRSYMELSRILPVDLPDYSESFFVGNTHEAHNRAWRSVALTDVSPGRWIGFITPDCFFASGSLGHFGRRMAAGKKAIVGFPLRVVESSFLTALTASIDRSGVSTLSSRELAKLALQHISPLSSCYLRQSSRFGHWPECLYYPVEGEGLIFRMLGGHCYAVNPSITNLDHGISPDRASPSEIDFLTDSDDYMNVSLTSISHQVNWFLQPRKQSNIATGVWFNSFGTPLYRHIARRPFLCHYTDMTPEKWRPVLGRSDVNVTLTLLASKFAWVTSELMRAGGMQSAATVIAWSLVQHGLHKACIGRPKLTIFAPTDGALESVPGLLESLLSAERNELARILRELCSSDDLGQMSGRGAITTLSGRRLPVEWDHEGHLHVDGCRVWRLAEDDKSDGAIELFACEKLFGSLH